MRHLLYIGCFLLQAYPALATIVVFGHHQGLSGQSTSQPGDKIQVYEVRLVNDGTSSLQAIALTLSDLSSATGITASAITQLSVYKSTDAVFDAPSDSLLGTQTIVNIGAPTTVSLTTPLTWSSDFPYFLVVATFNSTHTDEFSGFKDAFRVGSNAGAIQTSSGNVGSAITADDADRHTIDILATQITFATLPSDPAAANGDIVSGQVFTTQPVVEARDANGNIDIDATGSATISVLSGNVSLSGTTAQSWSNGRATFSNLAASATDDATVFTLQANASGLSSATSPSLQSDVVASQIVFTQEAAHSGLSNGDVLSGVVFQTQPIVQGQDQNGARDLHFQDQVSLTAATGTLAGTTTVQAQNGIATFSDIVYTATADQESFRLVADDQATGSGGDLVAKTANPRTADIVATQIVFTTLPSDPAATNGDIVSGQVFTTQPVIEAQNAAGQRDLNFTGTANLELAAGSISLSGTTGIAFNTGRADFGQSGFKAQATTDGASFALKAQATGLPDRDSATLTADIVATRIAFATAPSADGGGIVNDQVFATQPVVEARDGDGQRDIHANDIQVILSITSGNAVLSGATGQALQSGLASFSRLSATGTSGLFQISASALGLFADTLSVTLHAGPVAAIELSASAPSIQLGETDNVEVSALLRDANGNLAERGDNQVLFTLVGPGSFASGLSAVNADSGIARSLVTAAEAGTLYVKASVGGAVGTLSIPVVNAQPPYLDLNTSLQSIPADGSIATQLTVSLRDARGQLLNEDDTTPVRFSLIEGHGLLAADEVIARGGLVSVSLRGLGIAGPLTVRAEADGLEAAEIVLRTNPAAPYRIDLAALPTTIVADRNSTTVLSAVVRDSLGNIVVDSNLEIHFNISSDLAEITGPQTAITEDGNARTILRSSIHAGEVEITATVPGLVTGQTRLNLTAGPAVKIQLRATPTALPADVISTSQLIAEVLDVHGNQVADDSTTAISFSVSGGPGEILAPAFSLTHAGRANALLQSTGPPGEILVFAGASGLAPATFKIQVRQAQVPHFTDELPTLNLIEDGPAVRLNLSALTNDGDSNLEDLRFTVTADSAQVRLEIEGDELVATPVIRDYWGHLTATLTVRDPTGLESSALLPVTVQPQNDPPQFVSAPDSLVSADSLFIYQLSATDADGDPLTFTLIERPQGMAFDRALRRAVWRTPAPGVHSVTFAVSDGAITTLQHVQIRVAVDDTQLRFTSQPVTRTRHGQLYTYQPEINDVGNRPLTYSLVVGPQRMHINKQTGMITWISTDADTTLLDVTLQVSDGTRQQTQRFQIRLVEGNIAPVILSAPVEVAWIDSLYIYSLRATDTDDNTLAYNIVEGPPDMRINPLSGLLAWVPEEADLGVHEIILNTYDGQETTVQRYQLQVRRPGNPPRIGSLKGLAFTPDAELVVQLELDPLVTDPDHDDQDLLWSFAHLSGDLVSIDYDPIAQTVRFSATARFNAARIRLTVSDPDGHTAEHILRLGLREEGDFNGDATIDLDDFFRFVDAFGTDVDAPAWDGTADLNGDGQIDFDDFFVFIERFEENNARPGN